MTIPARTAGCCTAIAGMTYAPKPAGTSFTAGAGGRPLPRRAAGLLLGGGGRRARLKIGQTLTVNVLGRDITAKIANFRTVEWESLSINFVMVFSPNTFAGAPHAWLATLSIPGATAETERAVLNGVTNAFPAVTTVRSRRRRSTRSTG